MVTAGAPFTPPHSTLARAAPCALHPSPFHSCQSRALRPRPISSISRRVWDHEIVQGDGRRLECSPAATGMPGGARACRKG